MDLELCWDAYDGKAIDAFSGVESTHKPDVGVYIGCTITRTASPTHAQELGYRIYTAFVISVKPSRMPSTILPKRRETVLSYHVFNLQGFF
jgi:hypothetical protein